ncbi:MAG TPA: hypothetical protein VF658_16330 [Pyrinomonadaceae bacterium]|jgi:hypothetical protein
MNEDNSEIQHQAAGGQRALNGEEAGVLSELVALAEANRSLRNWPANSVNKAEGLLSEALFGRAAGPDAVRSAIGLVQELPVAAVEAAIAAHWPTINQERKDLFLSELTKHNSSKWLTRQAAIADKIARADQQAAAYIIHSFVSGGKAGKGSDGFWLNLSDEKRKLLQNRFLLSEEGWIDFEVEDERVERSLLAAFVEAATDPQVVKKAKSKRTLYDFARWAAMAQKRLDVEEQARAEIRSRVTELANQLPTDEWKKAVNVLLSADGGHVSQGAGATEHASPVAPPAHQTANTEQLERRSATDAANAASLPMTSQMLTLGQAGGLTNFAKVLAERSREAASLADRLAAAVADLEQEKSELEAELYQTKRRNEGLQSDTAAREARLSAALDELEKARAAAESLSAQLGRVRSELEGERAARTEERRALEEDAGRRIEVKLNGLKWKLAESLRPVFDNKRNTDDQEPSPRLAEFLRHWFDELESRLAAAGVKLGNDS